ncbi:MAG: glycosyltransferase family protein [Elainellaceae cyanobacterium]
MRFIIIVQARMTSTRLPGKVLKKVLGKPLLEFQLKRLQRVKNADKVVVATTVNDTDQPILSLCDQLGFAYFQGSENDVLSRYYQAASAHEADAVVRVTSDCPLIDPVVIDRAIQLYLSSFDTGNHPYDYVSNVLERTYPRGMDTEVIPFQTLETIFREATSPSDREHVTPLIHRQYRRFRMGHEHYSSDQSQFRWTVDTLEDFELIKRILENLYPRLEKFTLEDCLELMRHYPDWSQLNAHIEQKK